MGSVVGINPDAVEGIKVRVDTSGLPKLREQMPLMKHNRFDPVLKAAVKKGE